MRIVSLVPHATELLFALGAGADVVGVTHECDYPPEVLSLARVTRDALPAGLSAGEIDAAVRECTLAGGSIYELDRETLARLEPDLIVTQALCSVCAVSYEDVAALAPQLPSHPRVVSLDPRTLGETFADMRTLGDATGRRERAAQLASAARERIERTSEAVASLPRPRVLALEWLDPPYVGGHWVPQMIELAGGEDVIGRPGEPSRTITFEQAAAAEPEVVIVMPCGYHVPEAQEEARAHARELRELGAARVVAVDASSYFSRPGPRLVDGVELLSHILHREHVPQAAYPDTRALEVEAVGVAR